MLAQEGLVTFKEGFRVQRKGAIVQNDNLVIDIRFTVIVETDAVFGVFVRQERCDFREVFRVLKKL